jgi:demethylmenaquinone methyltransferase/2-methoxy-6-polyprenyl-1,4-benzoquinol methylase
MDTEDTSQYQKAALRLSLIKKYDIKNIFDCIAKRYDFANTIMSFGRHHFWRRFAIAKIGIKPKEKILDLCCGTGMITHDLARKVGSDGQIIGIDLSSKMLAIAEERLRKHRLLDRVKLIQGDASLLPFANDSFDHAIVGYGLRNVFDPELVLREMYRVIKPGGKIVALETGKPFLPFFKDAYYFYLEKWIPWVGRVLCENQAAYQYLRDSIVDFPSPDQFKKTFQRIGFVEIEYFLLTLGVVVVYMGKKPI